MDYILQIIGGSVLTGLGVFLFVFRNKFKTNNKTQVFQKIENPDKYQNLTPDQKVSQWQIYQEQLKKRENNGLGID